MSIEKEYVLIAPTGRAAKVIHEKTGKHASTIHRSIYCFDDLDVEELEESFFYYYKIRDNSHIANTIFIVDESSMISDAKSQGEFFQFGTGHLLSDLMSYSRISSESARTKIVFIGDPCQLPPVNDNSSKAFDIEYLQSKFHVQVEEVEMKEVKRQDGKSGVLKVAERIRKSISSGFYNDFGIVGNGDDIINPEFGDLLNIWRLTQGSKIIIAYKNKTCLDLNMQIRRLKYGHEFLPIQKSDVVIMGANNYRKGVFNGEFAVVNAVSDTCVCRTINLKGKGEISLKWREVELIFVDTDSESKVVRGNILENFLYGDNALLPEELQALFVDFIIRNKELKPRTEEFKEAILNDEYFNCLMVKYGYAVTCHKAQGGEWENVFTLWDYGITTGFNFFTDNQTRKSKDNVGFYRWAYTAVTRASKTLYALNPPCFHTYTSMTFIDAEVSNALEELTGTHIQPRIIELDNDLNEQLHAFAIDEQLVPIQDHFIKVRDGVRSSYTEIVRWEKKGLEISYYFERETQKAALKTWINKDNIFNGKYMKLPSATNSEAFYEEIEYVLKHLPNCSIQRNTAKTILSNLEFESELEEKYPFLKYLFDDICVELEARSIDITRIEHQLYRERYFFHRDQERAIVDFEYNLNGFFGRVLPIYKKCNSQLLVQDIKEMTLSLNH